MMKAFTLLKRGFSHPDYCEDFLLLEESEQWMLGAVFDGCSGGKECFFASSLFGKIIRNEFLSQSENSNAGFDSVSGFGQTLLITLFEQAKKYQAELGLDYKEILSTHILAIINKSNNDVWINIAGDGVIAFDNGLEIIDQNNTPDYMAYHFSMKPGIWIKNHTKSFTLENADDFAISTDGILSFTHLYHTKQSDVAEEFLLDYAPSNTNQMEKIYERLASEQIQNYDDIAMIRFQIN